MSLRDFHLQPGLPKLDRDARLEKLDREAAVYDTHEDELPEGFAYVTERDEDEDDTDYEGLDELFLGFDHPKSHRRRRY